MYLFGITNSSEVREQLYSVHLNTELEKLNNLLTLTQQKFLGLGLEPTSDLLIYLFGT